MLVDLTVNDLTVKEAADTLGIKPREDAKKYPGRAIPALVKTLCHGKGCPTKTPTPTLCHGRGCETATPVDSY